MTPKRKYESCCWGTRAKLVKTVVVHKVIKTYYCPKCDSLFTEVIE